MVKAAPASVELIIKAPKNTPTRARITHYRIDGNNSNAYTQWIKLNSPQTPAPDTFLQLHAAGELELLEPIRFCDVQDGQVKLNFSLPRYGVSLIEIRWGQ